MRSLILSFFVVVLVFQGFAQHPEEQFTRADTLRGMLTPLRTCYDVHYYDLDIAVNPDSESIEGSVGIYFSVAEEFDRMQIDLFENMQIDRIVDERDRPLTYEREFGAVFIRLPEKLPFKSFHHIRVFYSGKPIVARNPPWDGGFIWKKDSRGNPWIAVACQGTGASLWWPTKDHQSDEPDSMRINITVPEGLADISNGRLRSTTELPDGSTRYEWFVSYPINNYNVTVNIGKFAHFSDLFISRDTVTLDYYVMSENLEKAKKQFLQVKPMLACFEKYFGPFPFPRDGYKLVESPHLGMEHQSAVAYGNDFLQGYRGTASSEAGLLFDFIIIHESAHEWWGNSVTSKDLADMWIHEGFGAYAEAIYLECMYDKQTALTYLNARKQGIGNRQPIIGPYNVNKEGSGDMYPKGALFLNTLRHIIDDDEMWFKILKGIATTFARRTTSTDELLLYVNRMSGKDLTPVFEQYLKYAALPRLDIAMAKKGESISARYRWNAETTGFNMPVKVTIAPGNYDFLYPTTEWQTLPLQLHSMDELKVADDLFYIDVRITRAFTDPNKPK